MKQGITSSAKRGSTPPYAYSNSVRIHIYLYAPKRSRKIITISGIGPRLPSLLFSPLFIDGFLPNICDRGDSGCTSRFRGFDEIVRPRRHVPGSFSSRSIPCLRIGNVTALWRDGTAGASASTPRPEAGVESLSSRCMLVFRRVGLGAAASVMVGIPSVTSFCNAFHCRLLVCH